MMLNLQGAVINLCISSTILLQSQTKLKNESLILENFFIIPLGFVIGRVIFRSRINYLLYTCYEQSFLLQYQEQKKRKSFSFVNYDIYCRYIANNYKLFFSEYSLSKYSISLEQLITDHITKCQNNQDCVCKDVQKIQMRMDETGEIQRETFLGNQLRKDLLNQHLNLVYLNLIRQSNSKSFIANVYFSYFSFLGDILQNQNTLFIEIQKLCSSSLLKQMNIIDQTRLKIFVDNLYNKYQQKINAQQESTNFQSNSIYSIITYDEKLQDAEKQFTLCIQKKKKLVQLLCQQEFSLKDLEQSLQNLFDSREYLGNLLENLVEFRCYSTYLRCLCESFQSTFKSNSKLIKQIRTVKKIAAYSSKIPFYSENSCVVFLSLLENQIGQITSVSKNFFEITQIYANDQSIGKNMDFLIPKNIAKSHQNLLTDFLKQEKINLNVITKPQAICQDKEGWAVPYEIKFQISFVNQTLETGLACWLRRIKDERFHVLADLNKQISVITLSQQLHKQIFQERFSFSNLKKINLSEWIPLLSGWQSILQSKQKKQILLNNNNNKEESIFNNMYSEQQESYQRFQFDTILIKPQKGVNHIQINQETIVEDLIDLDLFRVNIELNFIQNKQMNYLHITFNMLEPFEDERQKFEHIIEFKQLCLEYHIQFEKYEESNENGSSKSPPKLIQNRKKEKMKSLFFDQNFYRDASNLEKAEEQGPSINNIQSETQINTTRQFLSNRNQYYMAQENSSLTNLSQINLTHIQLGKYDDFQTNQKLNNVDGTLSQLVSTNLQLNKIDKMNTVSTANNFYDEVESPIKHYMDLESRQQNYSILNNLAKQDSINQNNRGNFFKFASENNQISDNNFNRLINNQIVSDLKVSNEIADQQIQSDFNSDSISGTKQQTINRQASISGVSSTNSERQVIARFISKKSGLAGIQIINLLGGVALLVMAIYSLIMFIQTRQILKIDKQNFLLINWMSGINLVLSISDTNLAALELIRLDFFNFNKSGEKQKIVNNLQQELIQQYQELLDKVYVMYDKGSQDQIVFQNIVGNSLELILYQGSDESVFNVNCSLVYNIITQTGYISLQNNLLDPKKIFQHNMELNFQPLNSFIFNVTNKINQSFQERQDNQKTYLVQRISIFAVISFLFAISIIPTYSFVIKKQSDILKLFSTIEPEKINMMVQNLKYSKRIVSISNQRQQLLKFNKMLSFNSFKSFEQNQLLVKKKNISNTIPLETQYGKVVIIVMIFFIFLQIQPVVDYFTSTQFFQNCQDRYTSFMTVMDMQSVMNEQIQGRYNIILSRLYPQNAVLDVNYYSEFLQNRDQWTSENLKRFQDLQNTKSQNSQYQTSKMTNIYYKSIEVNACDTFKANPQYFESNQFDYSSCSQTNGGVMLQGLQIALKSFVQICSSFYQIQKFKDNNAFQQQIMQFYQTYSLTDTIIFKQQLKQALDYLLNFLKEINSSQYEDQINRQEAFIAWQLTTIFVTFFFGMIKYSNYVRNKIQQTKEYLNLIEIEFYLCLKESNLDITRRGFYLISFTNGKLIKYTDKSNKYINIFKNYKNQFKNIQTCRALRETKYQKSMRAQSKTLEKIIKSYFYLRQDLFEKIQRPALIGIVLLLFKYYISIQLCYFEYYKNNPNNSYIKNAQQLLLLYQIESNNDENLNLKILTGLLFLNAFVLASLLFCYILTILQKQHKLYSFSIVPVKYLLSTYTYGLGYISGFISMKFLIAEKEFYHIACANYSLTLIIIAIVCQGDCSSVYGSNDFLQKRNHLIIVVILKVIDQLGIIIYCNKFSVTFFIAYTLAKCIFRSLISFYMHPYISIRCQKIDFGTNLAIMMIPLSILLNSLNIISAYIEVTPFLLAPLAYMTGSTLIKNKYQKIIQCCYENISHSIAFGKKKDLQQLPNLFYDIYCRFLCSHLEFYYTEYSKSIYSQLMENIIQQHEDICYDYDSCFCSQQIQLNSSTVITDFLDFKRRKQYINSYEINNNNILLIELQRYNIILVKQRMGVYVRAQVNAIIEQANQQYLNYSNVSSNVVNNLDTIKDLKSIIQYDEYLINVETTFQECISHKRKLLEQISSHHINLNYLKRDLENLYYVRNQLEKQLFMLSSLQIQSTYLKQLCNAYNISFKFDERFSSNLKKLNIQRNRNLQFLIEEGCGFFVSLSGISLGNIIRTTRNFSEITNTLTNGVGKNIDFLIPKQLQKSHEKLLKNFLYRDGVDNSTFNKPLLLGCDEKGWAFPFELKYQLTLIDNSQIGLACHLKKHPDDHFYASVNLNVECQVITMSYKLYKMLFSQSQIKQHLNEIKLSQYIPLLIHIVQSFLASAEKDNKLQETKSNHETLFILPNKSNNLEVIDTKQKFSESVMKCDVYLVSLGLEIHNKHFMEFLNISFDKIQLVTEQQKKIDYILSLNRHLTNSDISIYSQIKNEQTSLNIINFLDMNTNIESQMQRDIKSPMNIISNITSPTNILTSLNDLDQDKENFLKRQINQAIESGGVQNLSALNDIFNLLRRNSPDSKQNNPNTNQLLTPMQNLQSLNDNSFQIVLESDRSKLNHTFQQSFMRSYSSDQVQSSQQLLQLLQPTSLSHHTSSTTIKSSQESAQQIQNIIQNALTDQNGTFAQICNQALRIQDKMSENNKPKSFQQLSYNSLSTIKESEQKSNLESKLHSELQDNKLSTTTGITSKQAKQKYALNKFSQSNNGLFGVQIIILLEYVLLFVIGMIVFSDFLDILNNLYIGKESFMYINWMSSFNNIVSTSNTDLSTQYLLKHNFYDFQNQDQVTQLNNFLSDELIQSSQSMNQLIQQIYQPNSLDLITFQKIIDKPTQQELYSTISQKQLFIDSTFIYQQITQSAYLHLEANNLDENKAAQTNAQLNFQTLNSLIYKITMSIDSDFRNNSQNQQKLSLSRLIIFASVSLIIAISFYPCHRYIINKEQQILMLFSTFDQDMIKQMYSNLSYCEKIFKQCSVSKSKDSHFARSKSVIQNETQLVKKKNISSTTPLTFSPFKVIFIIFLAFTLLQLEPLTQYIVSSQFYEVCSYRYSLTVSLLNLQSIITEILQVKQNIFLSKLFPKYSILDYSYFKEFAKNRSVWAEEDIVDFQKQLANKELFSKFSFQEYNSFFFKALENNGCNAINDRQQYWKDVKFNYQQCLSSSNGILQQGTILAIKKYIDEYQSFYQLILQLNDQNYAQHLKDYSNQINILDSFIHKQGLVQNIEILINFLKENNSQQYLQQILIQKILITWQLISIFIVFVFGFLKYFKQVKTNLQKCKRYINLIETIIIINNPYICSYLKQNI
ncbi:hypothetical protein ABPG74_001312 [Tetrahymena malaccensis]